MKTDRYGVKALPWLPLELRLVFPAAPAVYICVDKDDRVQYIGKTVNVKHRFCNHHRQAEFDRLEKARVYFYFIHEYQLDSLIPFEKIYIQEYEPIMNRGLRKREVH